MQTLRREIHPEVRVIDRERGIVDYVASDEGIDSYREVIRANGWRFNRFKNNAPFVDSHDYSTIEKLLGKVIGFRVDTRKGQLINTVQWAIGVGNELAELGWRMTVAGFLKAVSVGFVPTKLLRANSASRDEWLAQLKELGLTEQDAPKTIFIEQEQLELSTVIIGANSNALMAAHKAGAISARDVELIQRSGGPDIFQIPFETQPQRNTDMKTKLLSTIDKISGAKSAAQTHAPFAPELKAPAGILREFNPVQPSLRAECESFLSANADARTWLRAAFNVLARGSVHNFGPAERALTTGDSGFGQATSVPEPLSELLYSSILKYGAFRSFGVVPMDTGKKRLAVLSGIAAAAWLTPTNQGAALPITPTLGGRSISPEVATVGALLEVSAESFSDGGTTFEGALLEALVEGLSYRIDWTCLQGTGADDLANGGMTGIFTDANVPVYTAPAGHNSIRSITYDDLCAVIGAAAPAALQRECRWWIAPHFLPGLLALAHEGERLLKRQPGSEWTLLDFPVTWAAAAPSANEPGAKVALFGRGDAYVVGLRQDFELASSPSTTGWQYNLMQLRALARARCQMRDPASFAVLRLNAE